MNPTRTRVTPVIGLALALIACIAAYWPGLHGGYIFDDYPNIVENKNLQIKHIDGPNLIRAALASPSSELKRPLASLSFAANFFMTGLDPFWMKLTNLLIHLANGVLVFALTHALIRAAQSTDAKLRSADARWIAVWVAAAWLVLPINLTAVLYVVQRMESLANLFVLLSLLGYVHARQRMQESGRGFIFATCWLVLGSGIGLMSKETAVMTPLYAVLIEWVLLGARGANNRRDNRIIVLFLIVLVVPLVAGLAWRLPRLLSPETWATRNFDLPQRLMTEARVVIDYIVWTLLPTPQALAFYHDDYSVSTGWLRPWSTLASTLVLAALAISAIAFRKRSPLLALGLALFLGAQLLTGTILPLELVYEHRNYFASFGLLLSIVPALAVNAAQLPASRVRYFVLGALLSLWSAITFSTAMAWGSPLTLAQTLAQRAPESPRAQYGLGYMYIVLSKYDPDSPFTAAAYAPLEKAMRLPDSSILPEQALIMMNARMHRPVKNEWWESMITKLTARKPTAQDEGSLEALSNCVERKDCLLDNENLTQAFLAALSHPYPHGRLLAIYGAYAWNVLGDRPLGLRVLRESVDTSPKEPGYRITLIQMLIIACRHEEALPGYAELESMNFGGSLNAELRSLAKAIESGKHQCPAGTAISLDVPR